MTRRDRWQKRQDGGELATPPHPDGRRGVGGIEARRRERREGVSRSGTRWASEARLGAATSAERDTRERASVTTLHSQNARAGWVS